MTTPAVWIDHVIVSAYDTDFLNRWKPVSMIQAIHKTAAIHADNLGYSFDELAAYNQAWILSRLKIRFYEMPVTNETVTIRTAPKGIQQKIFFMRDSLITNAAGKTIAAATTAWLLLDTKNRRMLPASALNGSLPQPSLIALDEQLDKIVIPDGLAALGNVTAAYNMVDMMGHVNNTRYIEWITDLFPLEHYSANHLDYLQINYTSEVKPAEQVTLLGGYQPDNPVEFLVQGVCKNNKKRFFEAVLGWSPR